MKFKLFTCVVLTQNIPDEDLFAGAVGVIVEHHPATKFYPQGYEVEFFSGDGDTLVVSVPATNIRSVTENDIFHVREKGATI